MVNFFDEEEFDRKFEEEMKNSSEQLEESIIFAMVGDINTGKSSTINQIVGYECAPTGSMPGYTTEIKKYTYQDNENIIFADTPGLDDIEKKNSEETLKFFKEVDVILFFLNAAGTVFSEGEKKYFSLIKKHNKNILFILNKIDAAEDIDSLVQYVRNHSDSKFKVVPISSKTGQNIEQLKAEIVNILATKKKDLLFAKSIREKSSIANKWINSAVASAAAVGASPIPGSDIVPITGIQVALMVKLATIYNKPLSKDRAKELIIATLAGNIGKSLFRQVIKVVPGAGSVAGAGVAGGLTLALGHGLKYAYENDIEVDVEFLKDFTRNYNPDK
ncbi:YcjF family protein [Jeotgalibacillus haloalkalitolerans]|uniref:GTP-binding protein n=1 Tax=Jeotgalibacillus haloalkalitolerans TaxID=3104292 RepID=A0ABU5KRP0_9BACL|nr:GTPase [Jeotgalibacillus sp. HH7-29]MDZ5713476.1 GTP-binding protein [Jeotgalibacillus sp. HH7-29]